MNKQREHTAANRHKKNYTKRGTKKNYRERKQQQRRRRRQQQQTQTKQNRTVTSRTRGARLKIRNAIIWCKKGEATTENKNKHNHKTGTRHDKTRKTKTNLAKIQPLIFETNPTWFERRWWSRTSMLKTPLSTKTKANEPMRDKRVHFCEISSAKQFDEIQHTQLLL